MSVLRTPMSHPSPDAGQFQKAAPRGSTFELVASLCLVLACNVLYDLVVIRMFHLPLVGLWDLNHWEAVGYFFSEHLRVFPFPRIEFASDQMLFPYGGNFVSQSWGLERDSFFALFFRTVGPGPWLQWYYILSVAIASFGVLWMLWRRCGPVAATAGAVIVPFFNFYAAHKFPQHMHMAVIHWTTLNIIADYIFVQKIVAGERFTWRQVLARGLLLLLLLGQELAYVAAVGLASFSICALFVVGFTVVRARRRGEGWFANGRVLFLRLCREAWSRDAVAWSLLAASVFVGVFYLPLVMSIVHHANLQGTPAMAQGPRGLSELRLLIPYLPGVHPSQTFWSQTLGDAPEADTVGGGSMGWFLLAIGGIGLAYGKQRRLVMVPFVLLFLLCFSHDPKSFPVLNLFPWFAFSRTVGRMTIVFPVLAFLPLLTMNFRELLTNRRPLVVGLVALGVAELVTAYAIPWGKREVERLDASFFQYMEAVRRAPGEAVLDWPLCIVGGNGVGWPDFCPHAAVGDSRETYARFHGKKVVGAHLTHLTEEHLQLFADSSIQELLRPLDADASPLEMHRCPTPEEWDFLERFYLSNDFAGLSLATSLLPGECVDRFVRRFGAPGARTNLDGIGPVMFIPKTPEQRRRRAGMRGSQPRFEPAARFPFDLVEGKRPYGLHVRGFSDREQTGSRRWRWTVGPVLRVEFRGGAIATAELCHELVVPRTNQIVTLRINGEVERVLRPTQNDERASDCLRFGLVPGGNVIEYQVGVWNHHGATFAPADSRPLAIRFEHLAVAQLPDPVVSP